MVRKTFCVLNNDVAHLLRLYGNLRHGCGISIVRNIYGAFSLSDLK